MSNFYLGIVLLLSSFTATYTSFIAISNKYKEVWWFRLIELIFSLLFFIISVFIASFIK